MSGENLDRLAAEADTLSAAEAALDAPAAAEGEQAAAPGAPSKREVLVAEIAAMLATTAALLSPAFPSLATIYTEDVCQKLASVIAPVMEKYNLSVGGLFDRWGEEITLAATSLPLLFETIRGIKADLAARKKASEKPAEAAAPGAADPAPDVAEGTPGQLVIKPA